MRFWDFDVKADPDACAREVGRQLETSDGRRRDCRPAILVAPGSTDDQLIPRYSIRPARCLLC
jgi:hypothetical protein